MFRSSPTNVPNFGTTEQERLARVREPEHCSVPVSRSVSASGVPIEHRKRWTSEESREFAALYGTVPTSTLSKRFGRTERAIEYRGQMLGVAKAEPRWTEAEFELLRSKWPAMGIKCAVMFPERTASAVKQRACLLGLARARVKHVPAAVAAPWPRPVSSVFDLARVRVLGAKP